jgi:Glycine transporter
MHLIGAVPPAAISDWRYLAVSLLAGIVTFWRPSIIDRLRSPALLFDAAGLGLFAVAGTQKALAFGLNPVMAALLGMLTGIGGGMTRDVLLAEIPTVLRVDLYAVAALAGAAVVVTADDLRQRRIRSRSRRRDVVADEGVDGRLECLQTGKAALKKFAGRVPAGREIGSGGEEWHRLRCRHRGLLGPSALPGASLTSASRPIRRHCMGLRRLARRCHCKQAGRPFDETTVLRSAHAYEMARPRLAD